MDFQSFANFCLVSCKVLKAIKIEFDARYLSWGSSPKLASGSLLLVGIKPSQTVVGPPGCGSSCMCIAASFELTRCAGPATRRCWWCACSARPSAESEWRSLWTKLYVAGVRWRWNWWTGALRPTVPTRWSWHFAMTNLQPHTAVFEAEVAAT